MAVSRWVVPTIGGAVRHLFPHDDEMLRSVGVFILIITPLSLLHLVKAPGGEFERIAGALACASLVAATMTVLASRRALRRVVIPVAILLDASSVLFGLAQSDPSWLKMVPLLHVMVTVLVAFTLSSTWVVLQVAASVTTALVLFTVVDPPTWTAEAVWDLVLAMITFTMGLALVSAGVSRLTAQLAEALAVAELRSRQDPLTGALNRRGLEDHLPGLVARARRSGSHIAVLACDLDHFKRINDAHGHATGDAVLVTTARAMRDALRGDDVVGRTGGEEFVVLAAVDPAPHPLAERLRQSVNAANSLLGVTVSIGAVHRPPPPPDVDHVEWFHRLVDQADELLYTAKKSGRNRVVWQQRDESGATRHPGAQRPKESLNPS